MDKITENWDAEACKMELEFCKEEGNFCSFWHILSKVFEDTIRRVDWLPGTVSMSPSDSKIYPIQEHPTRFEVMKCFPLDAGLYLIRRGLHPAVLNASIPYPDTIARAFAGHPDDTTEFFRRTDLFRFLSPHSEYAGRFGFSPSETDIYPMSRRHGVVCSCGVKVLRGPQNGGYPWLEVPFKLDVITACLYLDPRIELASDRPGNSDDIAEATKENMRSILRMALENGNDSIVLTNIGVDGLYNVPYTPSALYYLILEEDSFRKRFKEIIFTARNGQGYEYYFKANQAKSPLNKDWRI